MLWDKLEKSGHVMTLVGSAGSPGSTLYYCEFCAALALVSNSELLMYHSAAAASSSVDFCPYTKVGERIVDVSLKTKLDEIRSADYEKLKNI